MSFLCTLLLSSVLLGGAHQQSPDNLPSVFSEPDRAARPYVWWHWMDGEVSLEGIKKDLEWMDRSGIVGFHQFDAGGVNMPKAAKVKRPYLSEGWKEAFRYALQIADSLGMEATVASAPGWSSTGGPWVSSEDAMKKLEWRTLEVDGGRVDVQLPALYGKIGPYLDIEAKYDRKLNFEPYCKDVAVVAVKLLPEDKNMEELGAELKISEEEIVCSLPRKTLVRAVTVKSFYSNHRERSGSLERYKNVLEASNDGKKWKEVMRIPPTQNQYATVNIPPTKAKYFRVRGIQLKGLTLHGVNRVEFPQEKGGFCFPYDFGKSWTSEGRSAGEVVVLNGKMSEDGHLVCSLPAGRWRIYRFGTSITGKINHPASPNATGLEVDKLDPDAWSRYFHKYIDMYKEAAGGMLGKKGIQYILTDSYEAGTETWTPRMPEQFKTRRGYDLYEWLPVLAGEIISGPVESEAFLWDWRRTIGELFSENYDRINDFCKEYGMAGRYTEAHETGRAFVGDGMDLKKTAAIPMSAIWMQGPSGSSLPSALSDIRESASVAHIYGQNITAAESFTVNGDNGNAYRNHPANMKFTADIAMWAGVNRFVIHESASQPSDDYLPGLGLFRYGQWFHRNDTWAPYAKVWTDYLARSCAMLQQGQFVADILLFYGEDTNATAQYGGELMDYLPQIPDGYAYDYASPDVLLNMVKAENGELRTASGMHYKVLMLGSGCFKMSEQMLRRVKAIADAGVVICGTAPEHAGGLKDDAATWKALADDIFNSGRKNVVSTLPEAIALACPLVDMEHPACSIRYVHRALAEGGDIYWIRNFGEADCSGTFSFRKARTYAALFNAQNGKMQPVECSIKDGKTVLELSISKGDAFFVVLSDSPLDLPKARKCVLNSKKEVEPRWDVYFDQKGGETATETFSGYPSWTENSDPVVRYYSGTATYKGQFNVSASELTSDLIQLDLGDVREIAEVFINGKPAGVLWLAPFRTDNVRELLREGENELEIKVTNLWVNRLIGDRQKGMRTVTKVRRFYRADHTLMPSGLLGPVKVIVSDYE